MVKPKFLLHACCAPCSPYVLQTLTRDYNVTVYFYDPNIHPYTEYQRRFEELKKYLETLEIPLVEGEYDVRRWFDECREYRHEPERGARCEVCFSMRMDVTARYASEHGFPYFGMMMTVSPQKDAEVLNRVGTRSGEKYDVLYYPSNFKKKEGWKKSVEMSRELGFYRQDYCGCIYSLQERKKILQEREEKKDLNVS
jgi:predicted adenine nucleotide alpha hydrolase (AANH) superfamily ATPase